MTPSGRADQADQRGEGDQRGDAAPEALDATGLLCPLPVLRLRKRLLALPAGGRVALLADDPAARIDVPHFCAEQGHALLAVEEAAGGALRFIVARGDAPVRPPA